MPPKHSGRLHQRHRRPPRSRASRQERDRQALRAREHHALALQPTLRSRQLLSEKLVLCNNRSARFQKVARTGRDNGSARGVLPRRRLSSSRSRVLRHRPRAGSSGPGTSVVMPFAALRERDFIQCGSADRQARVTLEGVARSRSRNCLTVLGRTQVSLFSSTGERIVLPIPDRRAQTGIGSGLNRPRQSIVPPKEGGISMRIGSRESGPRPRSRQSRSAVAATCSWKAR